MSREVVSAESKSDDPIDRGDGASRCDVVVIGGGIIGVATAMALVTSPRPRSVVVVEAEGRLAAHQTGHNSGVIHAGLYYRPGSAKAELCREGREALLRFCAEHDVPHEVCGKVVVATNERQRPALDELMRRGAANGLTGLRRLTSAEIVEREPHARGVAGLWVPQTGIVDYREVTEAYAGRVVAEGGSIRRDARAIAVRCEPRGVTVETTAGAVQGAVLVNCGGLQSDRIARMCGVDPEVRIAPFRGEYFELVPSRRELVRNLIYPVPDPRLPFLGVHFTRRIDGAVEAGPNAVLALGRHAYRRTSISARDVADLLSYPGFWRLARRHLRAGVAEQWRSLSERAFVAALRELVPGLCAADVRRAGSGVRAQALRRDGALVDDFHVIERPRMVHVLNAPSPAATASIAIGREIAARAVARLASS